MAEIGFESISILANAPAWPCALGWDGGGRGPLPLPVPANRGGARDECGLYRRIEKLQIMISAILKKRKTPIVTQKEIDDKVSELRQVHPFKFLRRYVGLDIKPNGTTLINQSILKANERAFGQNALIIAIKSLIEEMVEKHNQLPEETPEGLPEIDSSETPMNPEDDERVKAGTHEVVCETEKCGGKGQTVKVWQIRKIED
jgi:hypothetical protein